MTTCPPAATLRLIGTDAVGEDTYAGLEAHVEQCVDCQNRLEAATKAVPAVEELAPAHPVPPSLPGLIIERELGRGGASVVYLAWEPALERHVAVKLLPRNALMDPHAREHWLAEARACRGCRTIVSWRSIASMRARNFSGLCWNTCQAVRSRID